MTSDGLNVLDHMYMAEVVAMILVTAMTIQVNGFNIKKKKTIHMSWLMTRRDGRDTRRKKTI